MIQKAYEKARQNICEDLCKSVSARPFSSLFSTECFESSKVHEDVALKFIQQSVSSKLVKKASPHQNQWNPTVNRIRKMSRSGRMLRLSLRREALCQQLRITAVYGREIEQQLLPQDDHDFLEATPDAFERSSLLVEHNDHALRFR